jgi:hypothetical protein
MHSNGEKVSLLSSIRFKAVFQVFLQTNPGPLEAIMTVDPHIKAAVMFGRGKLHAGDCILKPFVTT